MDFVGICQDKCHKHVTHSTNRYQLNGARQSKGRVQSILFFSRIEKESRIRCNLEWIIDGRPRWRHKRASWNFTSRNIAPCPLSHRSRNRSNLQCNGIIQNGDTLAVDPSRWKTNRCQPRHNTQSLPRIEAVRSARADTWTRVGDCGADIILRAQRVTSACS